jgi:hypothetical protein
LARPGAFKSEKRKKELTRQKKQEKKRQRRLEKDSSAGETSSENAVTEEVAIGSVDRSDDDEPKNLEEKGSG